MTALSPSIREALDKARAHDPRPEAIALWDEIERLADASDDPLGTLDAALAVINTEAERHRAEHLAELQQIADSLGAEIWELNPVTKPAGLKDTEVYGWYSTDPVPHFSFPADRPLWQRLDVARQIADHLAVTA